MQQLPPISGGSHTGTATKFFGDPHNNNNNNHHHHHVALKCPRCESINTKFCYYNNYNLSQPRHFCKNCRRYWTNGGVLRNVPVGGGCRKPTKKRSSSSSTKNNFKKNLSSVLNMTDSTNSSDHESSSTTANVGPTTTPDGGGGGGAVVENDLDELLISSSSGGFEPLIGDSSTVDNSNDRDMLMFGGGVIDPTVMVDDLLQSRGSNGGLATLDWHDHQVKAWSIILGVFF